MKTFKEAFVACAAVCLAVVTWASPAAAQDVPFKVYITELWQLDAGVDPGLGFMGDYYAKVTINGVEQSNSGACDDPTSGGIIVPFQLFKNFNKVPDCGARTPWVFARQVPAGQTVHVKIQLFDSDLISDDEGDAKPGDGNAIEIDIDPATGQWSGDVAWPQTCSRPNLELGGNNVNVCFQASFDSDDDGLLDVWERSGVDTDNDGLVDVDLPGLGANPLHKDIFLEADYLTAAGHTHGPLQNAVAQVVMSFANAPLANPDGTTGVQLHVDVGNLYGTAVVLSFTGAGGVTGTYGDLGGGNAIGEAGNETIEAFSDAHSTAVKFADLKAANFNAFRESIFRYTIFGHQTNARVATNDCTSGQADRARRDFMVTLGGVDSAGSACWTTSGGFSVGSINEQAGTLMHEMGHTLGLRHGGDVDVNNKPNYLSVMNYSFQDCQVPTSAGLLPGQCDYSRLVSGSLLPQLDEVDLDECVGIAGGLGFGPVDWNGNGLLQGVSQCQIILNNTTADVNNDGICITPGANGRLDTTPATDDQTKGGNINDGQNRVCNTAVAAGSDDVQAVAVGSTPAQPNPLKSFDDWDEVNPGLIDFSTGFGTGATSLDQEPDSRDVREAKRFMSAVMAPGIVLDQTGPATAKPGDVLTYNVNVTNTGKGPALSAVLSQTSPDGAAQTSDIGIIAVGSQVERAMTFTVPANACPGGLTGASATLAFKDFAGKALSVTDVTPLQILDVAPPTLTVSLSPNSLWPPNHKMETVVATVTVSDNCDPNPSVRLISITSNEPESGFLGNGDKSPDIDGAAIGTDDRTFELRSERGTGKGSTGRVYTVTYRVTDISGNSSDQIATVTVPTSNSGK
jgi:uncharacterized repeat protein (TIGR01451 family)